MQICDALINPICKRHGYYLEKAIGKENNKLDFPITFDIDNEEVSNKIKIPESRENISYTNYLDKLVINSMFMEEIDYLYVMNIVKTLRPKVSSGFDEISSKPIKETFSNRIHPLTHIINKSLNSDQLILAKLIPVFKGFDADQLKYSLPG